MHVCTKSGNRIDSNTVSNSNFYRVEDIIIIALRVETKQLDITITSDRDNSSKIKDCCSTAFFKMKDNITDNVLDIGCSNSCNNIDCQSENRQSLSLHSPQGTVLSLCSPSSTLASSRTERNVTSTTKVTPMEELMKMATSMTPLQPQRVRFYALSSPEIRAFDLSPTSISSTKTILGENNYSCSIPATPATSPKTSRRSPYSLQKKLPFTILATSSPEIKNLNLLNPSSTMPPSTPFNKQRSSLSSLQDVFEEEEEEESKMEMKVKKEAVSPISVEEVVLKLPTSVIKPPVDENENINHKMPSTIVIKGQSPTSQKGEKSSSTDAGTKGRKVLNNRTNTMNSNNHNCNHNNSTKKKGLQKHVSSKGQGYYGGNNNINNIDPTLCQPQKHNNSIKSTKNRKSNHYRSSFQSLPSPEEIHQKKKPTSRSNSSHGGVSTPKTLNSRKLRSTNRHLSVSTGFR